MAKSTKLSKITINRLTKTQFKKGSFPPDSVNLVDPEFVGARVLVTDAEGDVVESATGSGLLDNLNGVTGPIQDQIDSLKAGASKSEYIAKDGYELHPDRSWSRTYDVEHTGKATVNYDDGNTVVLDESVPYTYENENFALSWYTSGDSGQWGFYDKAKKSLDYIYDYAKTDTSLRYDGKSADITIKPAHSTKETETGRVALVSDIADAVKVDASLDESSENPVQNKAVFAELKTKATVEALSAKRDKTDLEYPFPAPLGIEKWTGTFGETPVTLTWHEDESHWRGSDGGSPVVIEHVSGDNFRFACTLGDVWFTGKSVDHTFSGEYRYVLSAVVSTDTIALKSDIVAPDADLDQESTNSVQNKAVAIGIRNIESLLAAHTGNYENPHGVTAAQVDALPMSGGTLTGNLKIGTGINLWNATDKRGGRLELIAEDGDDGTQPAQIYIGPSKMSGGLLYLGGGRFDGGNATVYGAIGDDETHDGGHVYIKGGNSRDGASITLTNNGSNRPPSVSGPEITIGDLKVRKTIEKISSSVESVKSTTINGKSLSGGAVTLAASDVGAVAADTDGFKIEVASDAEATPLSVSPMLAAEAGASLQYLAIGPADNASKIRPDGTDVLTRGVADGIYALKSEIPEGSIVDSEFSSTSKHPLQNSVVTQKFTSVEANIETKVASRFPSAGGRIATNDIGFISIVPYSEETSSGSVIAISGDPNYIQKGGEVHIGGGVYTGGSIWVYASTVSGFNDHPKYYPGSVYIQKDDGSWMDLAGEIARNRSDIQYTWATSANLVTKSQKINNYALTSDITLAASDVGAVATDNDGLTISVEETEVQAPLKSVDERMMLRAPSATKKALVVSGDGGSTRIVPDGTDVVTVSVGDARYVSAGTKVNGFPLTGDITIPTVTVDSSIDAASENPVQNKAVAAEFSKYFPLSGDAVSEGVVVGTDGGSITFKVNDFGPQMYLESKEVNYGPLMELGSGTKGKYATLLVHASSDGSDEYDAGHLLIERAGSREQVNVLLELDKKATVDQVKTAIQEASVNYMAAKPFKDQPFGFNFGEMKTLWETVAKIVRLLGGQVVDFPIFE